MSKPAQPRGPSGARWRRAGVAIGLFAALLGIEATTLAAGHIVQARNYEYVAPGGGSSLTVRVGDRVTWVASGDPHTVTSGAPGAIDDRFADRPASAGILLDGESFTTTFTVPGTYPYFCEVHPEQMRGTVIVLAASTPAPSATPTKAPTPTPIPAATSTRTPASPPSPRPTPRLSPTPSSSLATVSPVPATTPPGSLTPTGRPARTGSSPSLPDAGGSPAVLASIAPSVAPTTPSAGADASNALPIALVALGGAVIAGGVVLAARRNRRGGA